MPLVTHAPTATTALTGPAYEQAVATGSRHIVWTACALCAVGIRAALAITEVALRARPAAPAPAAEPATATH